MARRGTQTNAPDRAMSAVVLAFVLACFLPAGLSGPAAWLGDLASIISAPISRPLRIVAGWVAPAAPGRTDPEVVRALRDERDHFEFLYNRERAANEELRRQMEQLRLVAALNPDSSTRLVMAPVIGRPSDPSSPLLELRAGHAQGVNRNDAIAVGGVQLLGRVERASERTSLALPITARASGRILGMVMTSESGGLECALEPTGDGRLRGDVAFVDPDREPDVAPVRAGQTVRLRDAEWPASAQMLVIGTVESVGPAPDSPLRQVVVVRPGVALDRVTEVIVRASGAPGGEP